MSSKSALVRALKWLGLGLLALFLLLVIAVLLFDWNTARPYLAAWVSGQTGREFSAQDLDVDLSLQPTITLRGLEVENAEWGLSQPMLTADSVEAQIDLRGLLRGEVVLPSVRLDGADLLLQRNAEGKSNWDFIPGPLAAPAVEPIVPEERPEIPRLGRFNITDLQVDYRSPAFEADLDLDRMQGRMRSGAEGVRAAGSGTLEGQPLEFSVQGGDLQTLRSPDDPYPVSLSASLGQMDLDAQGTIQDPLGVRGLDLNVTMSGADLANLHPIIPLPLPSTPVYRLQTGIQRDGPVWTLRKLSGAVGQTDLAGNLSIDLGGERVELRGALSSEQVRMSDLQGLLGAPPRAPDLRPDRLFPHRPIRAQYLGAADMHIRYQADTVTGMKIPLTSITADLNLEDGLLRMKIEKARIAGGSASGNIRLASESEPPEAAVDLRFSGIQVSRLVPATPFVDATSGTVSGHAELSGAGASVAGLLGDSNGTVEFAMSGGTLDNTIVEAIGLDVAELLFVLGEEGDPSPIRCAAGIIGVKDGTARPNPLIVDSRDSLLEVTGQVNLETESLDLEIEAHAKDPSLFTAQGAVTVGGTLLSPEIGLAPESAVGQAIGAAALAAIAGPLAAVVPFIDPGTAEDAACGALLKRARE